MARELGMEVDRHRPPRAARPAARLHRSCTRSSPATPSRGCAEPGWPTSSRSRFGARSEWTAPPSGTSTWSALATVADMVPLVGENRRLVREGLAAMRTRRAPRAAGADGGLFDRRRRASTRAALAFRLAPRINAAGRLYRADAGVELMLTEDADRAAAIAAELDRANHERREAEREVMARAEAALAELPDELREAPALVLAGEGWHRGVVGIVASRLVERHWRPVVLIGLDGDRGHGSGRSIPGFDLVEALDACSQHLVRHGGHAAAAGLELEAGRLEAFRRAFARARLGAPGPGGAGAQRADRRAGRRRRRRHRPRARRAARAPGAVRLGQSGPAPGRALGAPAIDPAAGRAR